MIHFSVEGNTSFTALLYIPSHLPQGFYSQDYKKGLQLYCRGVFIMDHAEELLPDSLRFVKGLVDSQDLSLNISREMLQHDHQLKLIAGRIEKKVLNELGNMLAKDREAYEKFFEEFGVNLKFGVYNNYGMDKEKFQDLLLFYSSREKKYVTLSEYVSRMKEDQKDIYFVSGKDVELIDKMPVVQTLKNKEFEVLYLTDEVDEFVMQTLMNYKEKTFRNAAQGDLDLDTEEEKEALNKSKEENKDLLTFMKEALGDEVAEVKLSNKLTEDPVCLTAGEGISFEMEKVFANMPNQSPMPMKATRILEINPIMKEVEGVGKLKLSEQENFYRDVLNESSNDLEVVVAATFYLGMAYYYYEGNFNKAKEIIEPIILQYQSMPFVRELISAFNLMGVMLYYDGANVSSRYYYEKALQIAMEHEDVGHYCYEYNNISITYVKQEKYEEALDSILKAKEFMPCCVEDMGAYVYLNLALIYNSLNQVDKALEAFNMGLDEHDGKHIILEDYLNCGIELFSKADMDFEFNRCADELEKRIETMYAVEYIDACIALFDYYLEQKMFDQVKAILRYMDSYMAKHPDEIR